MKITSITAFEEKKIVFPGEQYGQAWDGYAIETTTGNLAILVQSGQSCCESYGMITSEDDLQSYVGATLLGYDIVDLDLATKANDLAGARLYPVEDVYNGGMIFLTVNTDQGSFQLAVYNSHNGYYGHEARVVFNNAIVESADL